MGIKRVWDWLKSIWFIGSNLVKIVEGQKEINQRLDKIEKDITSPQYQVAELEKIQKNTELLKEHYELEIQKLQTGSQEEIAQHKAKIGTLENMIAELNKYKGLVADVIGVIKQKNLQIEQLNEELEKLKQKTSPLLGQTLLTKGLEYPYSSPFTLSELAKAMLRRQLEEK